MKDCSKAEMADRARVGVEPLHTAATIARIVFWLKSAADAAAAITRAASPRCSKIQNVRTLPAAKSKDLAAAMTVDDWIPVL